MIELLEHNKETYKRLCDLLENNNKCALVQATGTGKSYIAGRYIEEHAETSLILVPTNAIADAWEELLAGTEKEVNIITYQAFAKEPKNYLDYDLVIADEMHHLGSDVWGKKFVETYLQSENHKIIGLTATEIRYLDNSRDMAEEIFENMRIDGCDLSTAINTGVLPTFKYVSALYCDESDFDEWKEKAEKIKDIKTQTELKGRLDVCIKNMVSVKQAVNENLTDDYKKIIVFLNNVESKETALEMFKDVFPKANFYDVDYSKQRTANNEQINKFKEDGNRAVLFAVDMLNEGIHIKGTDCVIMFRKTVSPQVYLQQLGRGLASGTDKTPVIFDFVGNENLKLKAKYEAEESAEIINRIDGNLDKEHKIIFKTYLSDIENCINSICSLCFNYFKEDEIAFIKENYGKINTKEIAKILGRSKGVIHNLAARLGIAKTIENWTDKEIEIVRKEYASIGAKGIIEKYKISRSADSIRSKANSLGITVKSNDIWTDEQIRYLKENCTDKTYDEIAKYLGRSKNSVINKLRRMEIDTNKQNLKKVYSFDKRGNFAKEYRCISECAKNFGVGNSSVRAAIEHNYTVNGFYLFYEPNFKIKSKTYSKKKVMKLDKNRNLIKIFDSVKEATEESGLSELWTRLNNKVDNHIKETEFVWMYEEDYKKMIAEQKAGGA